VSNLSHIDAGGRATMVDVSAKPVTDRSATAGATLTCAPATLAAVREGTTPKGAVMSTAELAGIMAAKRTAELIPLCHPLSLSKVAVAIDIDNALPGFRISATARTTGQTGVEMEALTAVSVAALTLYDMLKAVDQAMIIGDVQLIQKRGGKRDVG
jgi:cyclic pyranopterin monophosphate synthase